MPVRSQMPLRIRELAPPRSSFDAVPTRRWHAARLWEKCFESAWSQLGSDQYIFLTASKKPTVQAQGPRRVVGRAVWKPSRWAIESRGFVTRFETPRWKRKTKGGRKILTRQATLARIMLTKEKADVLAYKKAQYGSLPSCNQVLRKCFLSNTY